MTQTIAFYFRVSCQPFVRESQMNFFICSYLLIVVEYFSFPKRCSTIALLFYFCMSELSAIIHSIRRFFVLRLSSQCSLDSQIKQWRMNHDDISSGWQKPLSSVLMKWAPHCMDHHPVEDELLVGGAESCLLYSAVRMDVPVREWIWGQEPVHCVKFNPVEHNVACALQKDNSLMLLDCRQDVPLRKVGRIDTIRITVYFGFCTFPAWRVSKYAVDQY